MRKRSQNSVANCVDMYVPYLSWSRLNIAELISVDKEHWINANFVDTVQNWSWLSLFDYQIQNNF